MILSEPAASVAGNALYYLFALEDAVNAARDLVYISPETFSSIERLRSAGLDGIATEAEKVAASSGTIEDELEAHFTAGGEMLPNFTLFYYEMATVFDSLPEGVDVPEGYARCFKLLAENRMELSRRVDALQDGFNYSQN